jgi:hypothetical protein
VLNIRQHNAQGVTRWSAEPPAHEYNNDTMRSFYVDRSLAFVDAPHSLLDILKSFAAKVQVISYFFLGPVLAAPLILAPSALWYRKLRLPLLGALVLAVGHMGIALIIRPHYFGPAACSLYAVVVLAMSRLWDWHWRDRPSGRFLVRGIVAAAVAMVGVRILAGPLDLDLQSPFLDWSFSAPGDYDRAALQSTLSSGPEKVLVIVRYGAGHNGDRECVQRSQSRPSQGHLGPRPGTRDRRSGPSLHRPPSRRRRTGPRPPRHRPLPISNSSGSRVTLTGAAPLAFFLLEIHAAK